MRRTSLKTAFASITLFLFGWFALASAEAYDVPSKIHVYPHAERIESLGLSWHLFHCSFGRSSHRIVNVFR
jgi:hypothetical protein